MTREDPHQRSHIMRQVKSQDTKPEMQIRRWLHAAGYRYRLHRDDLPGKPDIVFAKYKKVIFVNGCFWHGHPCKRGARLPKNNEAYWRAKIDRNAARDARNTALLRSKGWRVHIIWECELKNKEKLWKDLTTFLDG